MSIANKKQYLVNLPNEILLIIFSFLTIRQLATLSYVNKFFSNNIIPLPIWKKIVNMSKLQKKKNKLEKYITTVLRHRHRICELCYKFLPENNYDSALNVKVIDYKNHYIQLCIECRNNYYNKHPESINYMKLKLFGENNYATKNQIKSRLYLKHKEITTINKSYDGRKFNVDEALKVALEKYGGVIGYKVALKKIGDTNLLKEIFPKQKKKKVSHY